MAPKVWIYGDLIIKFDDYMYIVGATNGLIISLVKIKWEYRNLEPRWGWKSAVLCGEAAQGLVFLLERGLLQYLVKLALRVIPAPLVLFFLSLCHLKHDLLINFKIKIV